MGGPAGVRGFPGLHPKKVETGFRPFDNTLAGDLHGPNFKLSDFTGDPTGPESNSPAIPAEVRETTRQVAGAVQHLNSVNYAGDGREITFSMDRQNRLPIVKVIDTQSKEVIQQWPRDYVLHAAQGQLRQEGTTP